MTFLRPARSIVLLAVFLSCASVPRAQTEELEARVDTYVREEMRSRNIPGASLMVIRDGDVVLSRAWGFANLELSVPASERSVFQIASISKSFTALMTMMLVEEGRIGLDAPVGTYMTDLPDSWRAVTVRQLLTHTSGIPGFVGQETIRCPVARHPVDYERGDVLLEVACLELDSAPGERWAYGDTGYYLLGMLIESVSGMTYERFMNERLLEPLGMLHTGVLSDERLMPHRVDGYVFDEDGFRNAKRMDFEEIGNASLVSTTMDMAKLDAALDGEALLRSETLRQMWEPALLNDGSRADYGLGFGLTPFRGTKRVGHTGGGFGFSTAWQRFPDYGVTVILLTNGEQEERGVGDMANEIAMMYSAGRSVHRR